MKPILSSVGLRVQVCVWVRVWALLPAPLLLAGCASVPWVQPYERERLAAPLMQGARDTLAERHRAHVHEVREGARGATTVQGGGCGCN